VCQLEGSDHGGRDSAAELALAGTIDVQMSNDSYNRLTLGSARTRRFEIILLGIIQSTVFERSFAGWGFRKKINRFQGHSD